MGVALRGPLLPRAGPPRHFARVLLGVTALCGLARGNYIEDKDVEVSNMATLRMDEFCAGIDLASIDKEAGRESMRSAVGDENIFLDSLKEANNSNELETKFGEKLDAEWIGGTVGPIVMALVLEVLWWFFCWTACPCCKCCRCCAKQRKRPKLCKIVILLFVAAIGVAMIISVMFALQGQGLIEEGMDATTCTAAQVVEYTLNGNTEENFIGMLPMLNNLSSMKGVLADDSEFINDVFVILNATVDVETSSYLATEALQLFSDTLSLSANMNPPAPDAGDPTGQFHTCQLCTSLAGPLSTLAAALSDSSAAALASVYTEVQTQLGPESRASLRDAFDGGVTPLRESATMIRDSFKPLLEDDFKDMKEAVTSSLGIFVLVFSIGVILIAFCGCTSSVMCSFDEYSERKQEAGENPWNKKIAPCACCSWCCGWGYAVLVLWVGGIMVIMSVVASSVCMPLDELDAQLLDDIMPALDVTTSGDDLDMMKDMIDGCFSQQNDEDAILMEILFTRENGTKVNMSAKIKGQSTDLMKAKFATLDDKLATGEKMMDNADLADLLNLIANNPVDTLIVFNSDQATGSDYAAITQDPRAVDSLASSVAIGVGTSLACDDTDFEGTTIYGLNTLLNNMLAFDADNVPEDFVPDAECTGTVGCDDEPDECVIGTNCPAVCTAANNLMALKAELVNAATYRCDIFQDADGNPCDVFDMGGDASNGYTNDCLAAGAASLTRLQRTCNLAEFTAYVQQWEQRLTKVFQRVDDVLEAKQGQIQVNLRELVDKYITAPVEGIVAGSSCRFLKNAYGDLVSGLCFKGAMGFRYIALSYSWNGVLTSILILFTYGIWRHSVDNRNKWREDAAKRGGEEWASGAGTQVVPLDGDGKPAAPPQSPREDNGAEAPNLELDAEKEQGPQQEAAELPGAAPQLA